MRLAGCDQPSTVVFRPRELRTAEAVKLIRLHVASAMSTRGTHMATGRACPPSIVAPGRAARADDSALPARGAWVKTVTQNVPARTLEQIYVQNWPNCHGS